MPIRPASPSDALALATLGERTFRDAFGAMNNADDLELHIAQTYGEALQLAELIDPARQVIVVESNEACLIAYSLLGWGPAAECVNATNPGEIQRFYVSQEYHGRGIAQELMRASLDIFRQRHSDTAWLSTWQENPRGIAFYQKCGFRIVGEQEFVVGTDPQRGFVMARSLKGQY